MIFVVDMIKKTPRTPRCCYLEAMQTKEQSVCAPLLDETHSWARDIHDDVIFEQSHDLHLRVIRRIQSTDDLRVQVPSLVYLCSRASQVFVITECVDFLGTV